MNKTVRDIVNDPETPATDLDIWISIDDFIRACRYTDAYKVFHEHFCNVWPCCTELYEIMATTIHEQRPYVVQEREYLRKAMTKALELETLASDTFYLLAQCAMKKK